jgi:ribosome-binding protein aMBF1 (putative translation factor)
MITHNEGRTQKLTLRELRERSGLTRAQVAKKLNVDLSCVTHWELGDWRPLRKYHKKLAKMYGVTVDELLKPDEKN